MILQRKQKYLQVALNSTINEANAIIRQLPQDSRILIEAGTPLIKSEGILAVSRLKEFLNGKSLPQSWATSLLQGLSQETGKETDEPGLNASPANIFLNKNINANILAFLSKVQKLSDKFVKVQEMQQTEPVISERQTLLKQSYSGYIVADLKTADLAQRDVEMAKKAGASAVTCLGVAPIETIDLFIAECKKANIDSMVDMLAVKDPVLVLQGLQDLPDVVILHRGVDEECLNKEKELPYLDIQRIKNQYDILIALAGGDEFSEVQRAILNDVDIVVVWKSFFALSSETRLLAERFLNEVR